MALTAGSRLGPYEILDPLGAGGMGEVYRARDPKLNRDVAIKVLPPEFAQDSERMARFQREAQTLAALNHPNIAQIYGMEGAALVMELVPGESLKGPLPVEDALAIARQIADALEAAHDLGIVHRDLKPANVKVRPDGTVKVLDFGLAKVMDQEPSANTAHSPTMSLATRAGIILGTAAYMSPEQAVGRPVDRRSDIWSFGVVLWEMLAGSRMFEGETVSHTMADVLRAEIDVGKLPAGTPVVVRELLRRCLDRNVKTRLQSIGEARIAIEKYLANPSGSQPAAQTLATPGQQSRAWLGWAMAGVVAVAAATLTTIHFRETPPETPVTRFLVDPPEDTSFQGSLALSPDGRRVAFVGRKKGKSTLWIRPMDSLAAYELPGTESGASPFWSPDSKTIGFYAGGKLKRIEASGGPAITLCDASSRSAPGSWSRAGVILFLPSQPGTLHRVAAAGGVSAPVTVLAAQDDYHTQPWFLPDGDHFLYMARTATGSKVRVASLKADGKDAKDFMETESNVAYAQGQLLFQRDTTLMAQPFDLKRLVLAGEAVPVAEQVRYGLRTRTSFFSVSENGLLAYLTGEVGDAQLAWVDRAGKLLERIGELAMLGRLQMSRNGKLAAVSVQDKTAKGYDIWLYDLTRKIGSRFTLDSAHDEDNAVLSADGSTVVYGSDRQKKGIFDLYRKASNGSGTEELLLADEQRKDPSCISPDGKFLLYFYRAPGGLMALPLSGEPKPFKFAANGYNAQFSPDGRWVAYQAGERFSATNIFVAPFPGPGGQRQVSTASGALPRWRGDGKELYYVENGQLFAVDVSVKGATLEFGKPQLLFEPVRVGLGPSYDVSPDGKRFLLIQSPERAEGGPMTLVQNWTTALHR